MTASETELAEVLVDDPAPSVSKTSDTVIEISEDPPDVHIDAASPADAAAQVTELENLNPNQHDQSFYNT